MTLHALRLADRRRRLLPAAEAWVRRQRGRQRDDAPVHRARGAGLRPGSRRLLPDVAVHAREAGGDRARGCAVARRGARRAVNVRERHAEGEEALGDLLLGLRERRRLAACVRGAGCSASTVAGMSARTEIPTAHQNVEANAAASGSASRCAQRPRAGARACPTRPGRSPTWAAASWSLISPCSTTASTAVPIEPPIRCSAFSALVARGTCGAVERRVGRGHRRHHRAADPEPAHDEQARQQRVGGRAVEERERDRAEREDR